MGCVMVKQRKYFSLLPSMCLATGLANNPAQAQVRCENPIGTVVSIQGTLEVHAAGSWGGHRPGRGDAVCPEDRIQVGTLSRAVLVMTNNEILNLDQNTTVQLPKAPISEPSLLRLMTGVVRFFSNEPRSFDVSTPFLNAGVRGTEFLVQVGQTGTYLLVYEGQVTASNPQGQVELTANQAAFAQAGAAPLVQVPVAPLDAVQWTLYYQPVLSDLATGAGRAPFLQCWAISL